MTDVDNNEGCEKEVFCEQAVAFPSEYPVGTDCIFLRNASLGQLSAGEKDEGLRAIPAEIRRLDLSECRLGKDLNFEALEHLTELRALNLEFNNLQKVPANAFKTMSKLKILWLTGNHYHDNDPDYGKLKAASNKIKKLDKDALVGLHNLQVLYLHHNKIKKLDKRVFRDLHKLKVLKLHENPISVELRPSKPIFDPIRETCYQIDIEKDSGEELEQWWIEKKMYLSDDWFPGSPYKKKPPKKMTYPWSNNIIPGAEEDDEETPAEPGAKEASGAPSKEVESEPEAKNESGKEEKQLSGEKDVEQTKKKAEQEALATKKAEEERAAAAKRAEKERATAEKRAEEERAAAAKRAEEERVAATKRVEEERMAAAKRSAAEAAKRSAAEAVSKRSKDEDAASEALKKAEAKKLAARKAKEEAEALLARMAKEEEKADIETEIAKVKAEKLQAAAAEDYAKALELKKKEEELVAKLDALGGPTEEAEPGSATKEAEPAKPSTGAREEYYEL